MNDPNSGVKYTGEQNDLHRGRLYWPGFNGLPYRGKRPPVLYEQEQTKLYVAGDAWHGTFDLSDEDQASQYRWVRDRIRNGWFSMDFVHREWDAESKNMIVYMEWTQLYVQLSPKDRSFLEY